MPFFGERKLIVTVNVSVYRAACAASRRIVCLYTPGAVGSVRGNRSLELPVPDRGMEIGAVSCLRYGFSHEPGNSHFENCSNILKISLKEFQYKSVVDVLSAVCVFLYVQYIYVSNVS